MGWMGKWGASVHRRIVSDVLLGRWGQQWKAALRSHRSSDCFQEPAGYGGGLGGREGSWAKPWGRWL